MRIGFQRALWQRWYNVHDHDWAREKLYAACLLFPGQRHGEGRLRATEIDPGTTYCSCNSPDDRENVTNSEIFMLRCNKKHLTFRSSHHCSHP